MKIKIKNHENSIEPYFNINIEMTHPNGKFQYETFEVKEDDIFKAKHLILSLEGFVKGYHTGITKVEDYNGVFESSLYFNECVDVDEFPLETGIDANSLKDFSWKERGKLARTFNQLDIFIHLDKVDNIYYHFDSYDISYVDDSGCKEVVIEFDKYEQDRINKIIEILK